MKMVNRFLITLYSINWNDDTQHVVRCWEIGNGSWRNIYMQAMLKRSSRVLQRESEEQNKNVFKHVE